MCSPSPTSLILMNEMQESYMDNTVAQKELFVSALRKNNVTYSLKLSMEKTGYDSLGRLGRMPSA